MCGSSDLNPYYKGQVAVGLGATEIVAGIFSIGFGIWGFFLETSYFYIFFPVWCGALGLIAGSVTTASASKPSKSMINASLGLSVISVLAGAALIALSILSFLNVRDVLRSSGVFCEDQTSPSFNYTQDCNTSELCTRWINGYQCTPESQVNTGYGIVLVCLAMGGLLFAVALAAAIICCECCMKTPANKVFPISTFTHRRLSDTSDSSGYRRTAPRLMVNKTIQADFRPRTIRAKSAGLQTESSYLTEASLQQVKPTLSGQQQPPLVNNGQPQIYVLPMAGGQPPYQSYPYNNPYYLTEPYPEPTRRRAAAPPPPNRDFVRPDTPQEIRNQRKLPQKVTVAEPPLTQAVKPDNNNRNTNKPEKSRSIDGEEIVRIGDKTIHIRQN